MLKTEGAQLQRYLIKFSKGASFAYDGPDYQMLVRVSFRTRMILDQEKVMKLLKNKTPYKESSWVTCKVDYSYK